MLLEPGGVALGAWPGAGGHGVPAALPVSRSDALVSTPLQQLSGADFPQDLWKTFYRGRASFERKVGSGVLDPGAIMISGEGQKFLKVVWLHLSKKSSSKVETLKNCCREDWELGTS